MSFSSNRLPTPTNNVHVSITQRSLPNQSTPPSQPITSTTNNVEMAMPERDAIILDNPNSVDSDALTSRSNSQFNEFMRRQTLSWENLNITRENFAAHLDLLEDLVNLPNFAKSLLKPIIIRRASNIRTLVHLNDKVRELQTYKDNATFPSFITNKLKIYGTAESDTDTTLKVLNYNAITDKLIQQTKTKIDTITNLQRTILQEIPIKLNQFNTPGNTIVICPDNFEQFRWTNEWLWFEAQVKITTAEFSLKEQKDLAIKQAKAIKFQKAKEAKLKEDSTPVSVAQLTKELNALRTSLGKGRGTAATAPNKKLQPKMTDTKPKVNPKTKPKVNPKSLTKQKRKEGDGNIKKSLTKKTKPKATSPQNRS